jgi:4-amino-4-deoxy-L-arabinose transferase-like glycosyltransferase
MSESCLAERTNARPVVQPAAAADLSRAEDPTWPPSLPACLPLLWSRVLFPGPSVRPEPCRRRSLLLLLVLPGLLLYPCVSFYLFDPDEGRYAQIPREMFSRGEWIVPYLQGQPYLDKPPLLYWLVMACFAGLGVHDWAARLVPALAVHGCILVTYLLGRRRVGEPAAFWGALALALAPGFLEMGRFLLHDGLLALWATLAFFAVLEATQGARLRWGWWLTAAAACGLGILTKGPVVLLLVAPPVWLHRRLTGTGTRVGWRHLLAFGGLTLALAVPWYAAVCLRRPDFAQYFLWQHNVVRFVQPFDHREPVWYYVPIVLLGLLPGSLLLPGLGRFLCSGDANTARRRSPELGLLLLAGGWCVLFFSLSGSKLPTYILPAFPVLALALGTYLANSSWRLSRWPAIVAAVCWLLSAGANYVAMPLVAQERSLMSRADDVLALCSDRRVPVLCYPRSLDSIAFYTGRDDLRSYRGKETRQLVDYLCGQPRAVVLCSHYHSLNQLRRALPPGLHISRTVETRFYDLAVVERRKAPP